MLNERKLFFQLVRDHIPDGKRLKFIAKHGPDSVAEPMRALYNAIQSAKLPNGMMIVSECGRDCDGVVYSGKTRECVATLAGFYALYDETAEWAGTISYELLTRLGQRFTRLYSGGESHIPKAPNP